MHYYAVIHDLSFILLLAPLASEFRHAGGKPTETLSISVDHVHGRCIKYLIFFFPCIVTTITNIHEKMHRIYILRVFWSMWVTILKSLIFLKSVKNSLICDINYTGFLFQAQQMDLFPHEKPDTFTGRKKIELFV
jgi:hypothetical protein